MTSPGHPVEAWDAVFIRCRRDDVQPLVAHLPGYAAWWPGAWTRRRGDTVDLVLRPPRLLARTQRLALRTIKVRPDAKGVRLGVGGDVTGEAEWFALDERAGVVVNYLLKGTVGVRGWRRFLAAHRASVRAAMHSLKDRLERGVPPGVEPPPGLLAHQADAKARMEAEARAAARGA